MHSEGKNKHLPLLPFATLNIPKSACPVDSLSYGNTKNNLVASAGPDLQVSRVLGPFAQVARDPFAELISVFALSTPVIGSNLAAWETPQWITA
jgi:hypothetical protein